MKLYPIQWGTYLTFTDYNERQSSLKKLWTHYWKNFVTGSSYKAASGDEVYFITVKSKYVTLQQISLFLGIPSKTVVVPSTFVA